MWTFLFIFIIFFVTYWIPGFLLLRWTKIDTRQSALLAVPLGIAAWGWQGWIFGWLHLPLGAYVYIGIFLALFIRAYIQEKNLFSSIYESLRTIWSDRLSVSILVLGVASQTLILWNVLQPLNNTWTSCCGDPNDNIWYASITRSINESFPPQYPGITGQTLHNYHYWSNLIIADITRVFQTDQVLLQFRYSGLLLSMTLGMILISFSTLFFSKPIFRRWLLFLFYFGGDLIYMLPMIQKHIFTFPGSSLEDGVRFLSNPPRSYAVILALVWLTLYSSWRSKIDTKRMIVLALLLASTIGFKVYVAFFLLAGLGVLALYDLSRKNYETFMLMVMSCIASAFVYLPVNSQAGGLYFVGFWRFENFVSQPGFDLLRLEMARMIFYDDHKYIKAGIFDLLFITIYTVCIFGTKLIGLVPIPKRKARFPVFLHILLVTGLVTHFGIGAFFQQSTGGSNTFNFHVNVFLFLSLYAALVLTQLHELLEKKWPVYLCISAAYIFLTIPRASYELSAHIQRVRNLYPALSPETQQIVDYLTLTPNDTMIAVAAKNIGDDEKGPFMYWYTNRHQYLSAPNLLKQFGADTFDRERNIQIFTHPSAFPSMVRKLLRSEGIDYLVVDTGRAMEATKSSYWLTPVLQTEPLTLMKVDFDRPMPIPQGK